MNGSSVLNGIDLQFLFLDRIYRINGIFFRRRQRPLVRRPFYLKNSVNPV